MENNFLTTLNQHLDAIQSRNLALYEKTIAHSPDLMLILPNGKQIKGFDKILDFHKEWLNDQDWKMEYAIINHYNSHQIGYALLEITYYDLDENGNSYTMKYLLSLIFEKMEGQWKLIYDQNTMKKD